MGRSVRRLPSPEAAEAGTGYVDLEAQFVSVEALMTYAASQHPLVPVSSLVETGDRPAVFTIVNGPAERDRYWHFTVSLQPVNIGHRTTHVASVTEVTPCDQVVIDPPSTMTDQMKVRTPWQPEDEHLDLGALFFDGAPPAPLPAIWGGIARQEDDQVEIVWSTQVPCHPTVPSTNTRPQMDPCGRSTTDPTWGSGFRSPLSGQTSRSALFDWSTPKLKVFPKPLSVRSAPSGRSRI